VGKGLLDSDGVLARWLRVESLAEFCSQVFKDLRTIHGVSRLLILSERAGSLGAWAAAPSGELTSAMEEWFESSSLQVPPQSSITESGESLEEGHRSRMLDLPKELNFDFADRLEVCPGVAFRIYWTRDTQNHLDLEGSGSNGTDLRSRNVLWKILELALINLARLERVRELSHIDMLTGIFNRRHFSVRLNEEIDRARRFERPLALLITDLDSFKSLNDARGHQAGDVVLRYVAQLIRHTVRSIDILCRLGGDEFAVLMPDTDMARSDILAERLRRTIAAREFAIGGTGEAVRLRVSSGGAVFPQHADQAERLLWCADMALLEAKRRGGDQVVFFDPSLREHLQTPWHPPGHCDGDPKR
jgi:diguanylate cyclase (GGDEF)-like protein